MQQSFLSLIKHLPIDLGQGTYRNTTRAKTIAHALAGEGKGRKALDMGCGTGFWSQRLRAHGWEVTSADKGATMPGCLAVDGEQPLPFENDTFDMVWMSEVLEHIADVDGLLAELRRIVKPTGGLIITTPNSYFWLYSWLKPLGLTAKKIQNPDHKQFFSLDDMKRLFPRANIYGFFPYNLVKMRIRSGIGLLSPTFIIEEIVEGKLTAPTTIASAAAKAAAPTQNVPHTVR